MTEFLQYQDQTSLYYSDLMTKLERMNSTLGFVLHYLDNMQSRLEERLHVIQRYLGWAGMSLTAMWTCMAHTGFFVLGAVLLTFLGSPGFSRAMLLFTVPLNAVAEVNQQPALDFCSLGLLLLTLSLGYWFIGQLWILIHVNKVAAPLPLPLEPCEIVEPEKPQLSSPPGPPSSTPERKCDDKFFENELHNQDGFLSGEPCLSFVSPSCRKTLGDSFHSSTPRALVKPVLSTALIDDIPLRNLDAFEATNDSHDFGNDSRSVSYAPSVISNSSISGRLLCNGITKTGKTCKKRAVPGQEYCRVHEGGHTSYVSWT